MTRRELLDASGAPSPQAAEPWRLHLFVAGEEPNSQRARENLKQIIDKHIDHDVEVTLTDVLEDFQAALNAGVYMTPALIVDNSGRPVTIFGNLSNTRNVLHALGLEETVDG